MRHVRAIAHQPHPVGSPEAERVRAYLLDELRALGLAPTVQRTTAVSHQLAQAGRVANVLARLDRWGSTRPVVLAAHYDSVATGPGAADAAAGVAAILETARALRAGPPLRNDVILLLTDGEEPAMLGAEAFVAEHPWAAERGLVLNLKAGGRGGPVVLERTSAPNGRLVRGFSRAAPRPVAGSLAPVVNRALLTCSGYRVHPCPRVGTVVPWDLTKVDG